LYELDAAIEQDSEFSLEGILPGAIQKMRSMGDGKLYDLAPTFSSDAIFYNKKLFEEYGVPLPQDGMIWNDLLLLAERFLADFDLLHNLSRVSSDNDIVRNVSRHYGSGSNHRIIADRHSRIDYSPPADPYIVSDRDRLPVFRA
jgi:hypothetical protein